MSVPTEAFTLRKMVFAAVMTAATVLLAPAFSFPLGVTRAFPLQHMANIFLAVLAGTRYSTGAAFAASLIRNMAGTGSILAFPGSMIGAFLSGWLYRRTGQLWAAVAGEFIGTSLLGGLAAWPAARLLLGSPEGAFFFISLFAVSCGAGCAIAYGVLKAVKVCQPSLLRGKP